MGGADVIVAGGGHNGLICAAYLARSGFDTLVVEAQDHVGGCAATVEDLGVRFNVCNCDHTLIRAMPIADELELAGHGLEYLEPEASGISVFHDGAEPLVFFHESERMLDGLARSHPGQVDGYRRYLKDAVPVAELALDMARTPPAAGRFLAQAARGGVGAARRLMAWSRASALDVLSEYFDDWHLAMPAITTGPTVWGLRPDTPGTGLAAVAYANRHLVKLGRPRGGSGALTDAVRASLEAAGGRVRCGASVERLLVRDGRVAGVRLADGDELTASTVVAACDPRPVLVEWLDGDAPAAARRLARRWRQRRPGEGYESKIDAVLSAPPRYRAAERLEGLHGELDFCSPTMTVLPDLKELTEAHELRAEGRVADRPSLYVNVPSVLDGDMGNGTGRHVLSIEVLYTPYSLPGGWAQSSEPRRWLEMWAGLVEGDGLGSVVDWRVMTPDRYEREMAMARGHAPSYSGSRLQALIGRPRELTRYRTPLRGLYLCGAGTFPGAGVFGASGRNAAAAVARDRHGRRAARRSAARPHPSAPAP